MKEPKDKIVIYREPNGTVHPISIAYGCFFIGADTIAVFTQDSQIKSAIEVIKDLKKNWTAISKDGKFHILQKNKSYSYPIKVATLAGVVNHGHKGTIRRGNILSINGFGISDWIVNLRKRKQLSIA